MLSFIYLTSPSDNLPFYHYFSTNGYISFLVESQEI
jgi:hypothetical protein